MKNININDMPESFRELAEIIGEEAAMELCRAMGGLKVYIPKTDSFERIIRNKKIVADFNGSNYAELATRYGFTESHIRNIINEARSPQRTIEDFLEGTAK